MTSYKMTNENGVNLELNGRTTLQAQSNKSGFQNTSAVATFDKNLNDFLQKHRRRVTAGRNIVLLLLYLAYYAYAMYCNFGDEGSIRLTVFTCFGLLCLSWSTLKKWGSFKQSWQSFLGHLHSVYSTGRRPTIIKWFFYLVWTALCVVYIVIYVALKDAKNLRPLGGMAAFLLVLFIFSKNRSRINWHCVFYGTILQCLLGLFVIKTSAGTTVIMWFSDRLSEFLAYSDIGSQFVFGDTFLDHQYAMQIIPSIIMFIAVIAVLIHFGAIQFVVSLVGKPMAFFLEVSAPEAINAVANIVLGGAEAGGTVLEYLLKMPPSQLFCVCVSGFASCSGSSLIQFRAFGVPLKYLLAASAMSAPAALVCGKMVYPDEVEDELEKEVPEVTLISATGGKVMMPLKSPYSPEKSAELQNDKETILDEKLLASKELQDDEDDDIEKLFPKPKNVGEALVNGTKYGVKLAASIISLLIVSLAVIELLDKSVAWFGDRVNVDITLKKCLSYLFYPFVYLMGVDTEDCLRAGELLGLRTLSSPGIPYIYLGQIIRNKGLVAQYTALVASMNQTFTYDKTSDIFLPLWNVTLPGGVFTERSELITTYALCGFASFPTIGVSFGLISAFIPKRLPEITAFPMRLLLAGTIASYLTACVAGLLS